MKSEEKKIPKKVSKKITKFLLIVFKEKLLLEFVENKLSSDVGEEIISRLKEIIERLNKILAMKNEKEYKNPLLDRIRS